MSLNNIIQSENNNLPPNIILQSKGIRLSESVESKNLFILNESSFFGNMSCLGQLAHFYNNLKVDGALNAGSVDFNNIVCQTITGATGSFSAGVTGASLHGTAVTGGNASFTGAGVFGSVVASNATLSAATVTNNLNVGQTGTINNLNVSNDLTTSKAVKFSGTSGHLDLPILSTVQRNALTGTANGTIIYNSDSNIIQLKLGGTWYDIYSTNWYTPPVSTWNPSYLMAYLSSNENYSNSTTCEIGQNSSWKVALNNGTQGAISYAGAGRFNIGESGYFGFNATIEINTNANAPYSYFNEAVNIQNSSGPIYWGTCTNDSSGNYYTAQNYKINFSGVFYASSGDQIYINYYLNNSSGANYDIVQGSGSSLGYSFGGTLFNINFLNY